ncbi:hypothetical protein ACX163_19335 [Bacillus cereus]
MIFQFRPFNSEKETVVNYEKNPITLAAGDHQSAALEAKRGNTFISAVHVKPENPDSSHVIVPSIIDDADMKIVTVYLRNLHPTQPAKVNITFLESDWY